MSTVTRSFGVAITAIAVARCSSSAPSTPTPTPTPTPPSPAVTTVVTSVQGADGTQASQQTGTLPAASGGPTVTVTANGTVINGGSDVVRLQSATPFQTVYVSVPNTSAISAFSAGRITPLVAATGYFRLTLTSATTDTFIVTSFARALPANTFTLAYAVATAAGAVGTTVTSTRTVNTTAATGDVQVSVAWNTRTDVDLHVVDPRGEEVYWNNTTSASGGKLDLDSNANCTIDGKNNENIRWPSPAPAGQYTVRVDYYSACSETGTTTFAVAVNNGGTTNLFTGTFTAIQADKGGRGNGRTITTFTHTAGIPTSTVFDPFFQRPPAMPSQEKLRLSGER